MISRKLRGIPDRLAKKVVAAAMYTADPLQLMVTLKGTTNRAILLSILFFSSQARNISGMATALN